MKTAMMELIDILNKLKVDSTRPDCITKRTGDYRIGLDKAITEASNLLRKEREQMIDFGNHMQIVSDVSPDGDIFFAYEPEQYFTQTFNQEI